MTKLAIWSFKNTSNNSFVPETFFTLVLFLKDTRDIDLVPERIFTLV